MKKIKKRHHFIAKHHLELFSRPNGNLWLYQIGGSEPVEVQPRDAAVEKYLYAPEVGEEPHDDTLEDAIADCVDGPASSALRKLIQGERILPADRAALALYVALQEIRIPGFRDRYRTYQEQIFRVVIDILNAHPEHVEAKAAEFGTNEPGKVLAGLQALKTGDLQLRVTKAGWLEDLFKLAGGTAPLIAGLKWVVIGAPQGFEFVISDRPVGKVFTDHSVSAFHARGWLAPSVEGTLVLDPWHVLVMRGRGKEGRQKGQLEWCQDVNRRTVGRADRFIFSRKREDWILAEINQRTKKES